MDIQSVSAVGYWSFVDETLNVCAICRNGTTETCIDCAIQETSTQDCKIAWGVCGHCFHGHCLDKFLRTRGVCPLGMAGDPRLEIDCSKHGFVKVDVLHVSYRR